MRRVFVGVDDGDEDFVNGGTSENRRVGIGEEVGRNKVFTLNLSIGISSSFPIEKTLSILFQMNVFERKREKISFYIYNESIKTVGG